VLCDRALDRRIVRRGGRDERPIRVDVASLEAIEALVEGLLIYGVRERLANPHVHDRSGARLLGPQLRVGAAEEVELHEDRAALAGSPLAFQVQRLRVSERVVRGVIHIPGEYAGEARVLVRAEADGHPPYLRLAEHVLLEGDALERYARLPTVQLIRPEPDELARPVRLTDERIGPGGTGLELLEWRLEDVAGEGREVGPLPHQRTGAWKGTLPANNNGSRVGGHYL